ncbi:hypothetical protein M231_06013 [Tremella mesenterica]|uniref:Kinesin motor domain-containing protein n=1 Tax=Tremella mesenterica TaxID=5217 RepID=A0A4Q1BGL3_TREME|nr:hypothetical protein M231_06013 [Tremella mesenterica]
MQDKSIQAHARVRPHVVDDGHFNPAHLSVSSNTISTLNSAGSSLVTFSYDRSYDGHSSQKTVFEGVQPLQVDLFLNATVVAFGVTGSGKTFTMQGTSEEPGIIPQVVESILGDSAGSSGRNVDVSVTYLEILKDQVYDLLADRTDNTPQPLQILESQGQPQIPGLTVLPIGSMGDFDAVYQVANARRKTASTKLNSQSSRSHAILSIHVEIRDEKTHSTAKGKIMTRTDPWLCDLAGSENNRLTGNDKERMAESKAINTSLSHLGRIVDQILAGQKPSFRTCKLTRLMQDSLGGTSRCLMICCVAPGEKYRAGTFNTLQFGDRSKKIKDRIYIDIPDSSKEDPITTQCPRPRASLPIRGPSSVRATSSSMRRVSLPARTVSVTSRTSIGATRVPLSVLSNNARPMVKNDGPVKPSGLTEDDVKRIVRELQSKTESEAELIHSEPRTSMPFVKEDNTSLTEEQKQDRFRVLVDFARDHHEK